VAFEDVPMLVLAAYVAARLVVARQFDATWPLATAVTMLFSEVAVARAHVPD
jgi:hypothetical protein